MAKQKTEGAPVPYPKNWGRMTRAERDAWEVENRGREPRPVVEPVKPARTAPRATSAPTVSPTEADEADEYNDTELAKPAAGRTVHDSATAEEVRKIGVECGELADRFDGMTGRQIVLAILQALNEACKAPADYTR